ALYDSIAIAHDIRWDLPLCKREQTLAYMKDVQQRTLEKLADGSLSASEQDRLLLSTFHEDMHGEAFTYTRQTLGYPAPCWLQKGRHQESCKQPHASSASFCEDAEIPGGTFWLGATEDEPFVFDNEKWAHPVQVQPFVISRTPVSQEQFAEFVAAGGYGRQELWSRSGWQWRQEHEAEQPVYWRRGADGNWARRCFDEWVPLEAQRPVLHVNWHEAQAYCRWSKRRLPTEVEWEVAAAAEPESGELPRNKRRYPWGESFPEQGCANLDSQVRGCIEVDALGDGDSAFGCRQLLGNVWEWTESDFFPYPGFEPGAYREFSKPWFGTHKVLRGGCWATRSRMLRNTLRNFYTPNRRDVWAGFRTCALPR
ncbi:MAG: SUMF1/EgtB/PvdO family nonheme iron enzyme, partial [Planctomycetota bacterium]